MMLQIDHPWRSWKRIARILIAVLIFLLAAAVGLLGGEWGQASAQTIPTLPPTSTSPPATQAPPERASSTPTATFIILPSPTSTPPQTATVVEATETAVPSDPTIETSAVTPTDKPEAVASTKVTVTPPQDDQSGLEADPWWQSPWTLAIGLALLLAVIGLIRGRKGAQDR